MKSGKMWGNLRIRHHFSSVKSYEEELTTILVYEEALVDSLTDSEGGA